MAGRMASLVDADTGKARDGAVVVSRPKHRSAEPFAARHYYCARHGRTTPAQIVHKSFTVETALSNPVGTGFMLPDEWEVGVKASIVRNEGFEWWGYAAGKGGHR
jgi:peptide/nickel transport system substrate-binding protein